MLSDRVQAWLGFTFVALLAVAAIWAAHPAASRPADTPESEFSSARAMAHVRALASSSRPVGTGAHREAREYLVVELERLGWETEVQNTWTRRRRGTLLRYARLQNVLAHRPGTAPGPAVLVASHYDSVPTGPGAGDAATPVAAILEALRASDGEAGQRDVRILFSDGEEAGLLGAQGFAEQHRWIEEIGLVLNFEARGNSGVPWMFETGAGAGPWVEFFGRAVPRPFANSFSTAVYRRMPNDTDYSIFRERGIQGLNFAMIGSHPAYHSQLDTPENLDQRSLQSMGDSILGMLRALHDSEWQDHSGEATYFNLLGSQFVAYPRWIDQMALVAGLLLALLWLVRYRQNLWSSSMFALGAWGAMVVVVGLSWMALVRLFPALVEAPNSAPYRQSFLIAGWLLCALAVGWHLAGWIGDSRRAIGASLIVLALVSGFAIFGFAGGAYLFVWPLLAVSIAAWIAVRDPQRRWIWFALAAVPVPLLYAPLAREALLGLTPHRAWVVAALVGVGMLALLPILAQIGRGSSRWRIAAGVAGLACLVVAGASAGATSATPRPVRLAYLMHPDQGPLWVSRAETLDPWLEAQLGTDWRRQSEIEDIGDLGIHYPSYGPGDPWVTTAPWINDANPPTVVVIGEGHDQSGQWVDIEVRLARNGAQLWLMTEGPGLLQVQWLGFEQQAIADGRVPAVMVLGPGETERFRLWFEGPQVPAVTAYELTYGLPGVAPELPDWLLQSGSWTDFSLRVASRLVVDQSGDPDDALASTVP